MRNLGPQQKKNIAVMLAKQAAAQGVPRGNINPLNKLSALQVPNSLGPSFPGVAPVIKFKEIKQKLLKPR